jgi:6-phosphogluconolactonase (cycloisomerase 2 family)
MRMKFNKSSQLLLVAAASLLVAALVTACGTLTTDFVYVTSSKAAGANNYGEIDVFEINAVSGFMRQIPTSPFPSAGRNPVAEAISPDYENLYVVNHDDDTVVQFKIGPDGKLYPLNTVDTPGIFPLAVAVNSSYLFVADTYQPLPGCSTLDPCTGSISVYTLLTSDQAKAQNKYPYPDSLGSPVNNPAIGASYWPLTLPSSPNDVIQPTGIMVLPTNDFVYVSAYDTTANAGYVFAFSIGSGGVLKPLNGGVPIAAGVHPSAIASDSTGAYLYITDSTNSDILGYAISSGSLTKLAGSPYPTGNQPSGIAIDSEYPYAYVANALDGNVTAYSISNGVLTRIGSYAAGIQPVAIGIDPSTNHFVFTANFLGNGANGTISDFEMSTTGITAGTLIDTQHTPYTANAQPTAVAAVPHKVSLK